MTIARPVDPITEDDAAIAAAVRDAELPSLLAALAHVTGDRSILRDELRPRTVNRLIPQGGLTDEEQEEARRLVVEALIRFRDAGCPVPEHPGDEHLLETLRFLVGGKMDEHLPLLLEELMLTGDPGAPRWTKAGVAPTTPFEVVVIGAGMSGLLAGHRLQQAGVPFTILEKNDDVGGTWLENRYPGCRVDVSNHLYSYSFAQKDDWPQYFSTRDVLLDYFRAFADDAGLRERVRFRTEVVSATFDEQACAWDVVVRGPDGAEEVLRADAVISAVGQLNRPSYPRIEGAATEAAGGEYAGRWFHSARWDDGVDLTGKRVGVIGTGASAFQFLPIIAEQAAELKVYQRTAPWMAPSENYHWDVAEGLGWLFRHVPHYSAWYRFWLFCSSVEGMLASSEVDDDWDVSERSVGRANERLREVLTAHILGQYEDHPELGRKVLPDYPPAAKRMLKDNGEWARTLKRDHVELVTTPIGRIGEKGVVLEDGTEHEVDVLIYATGFQASNFLVPMEVRGRGGVELHERWGGDARAYLGMTVPGFPNLFLIYGPNTNIVVNGSIIFFSECSVAYVVDCIRELLLGGHRALDVRADVHDAFNARVDEGNRRRAWGASGVHTWYKNELGRVSQNWPFTLFDYWQATKAADLDDFEVL